MIDLIDPKCLELAEHFLGLEVRPFVEGRLVSEASWSLAQRVQEAVDCWFEGLQQEQEAEREDEPDSLRTLGLSEADFR